MRQGVGVLVLRLVEELIDLFFWKSVASEKFLKKIVSKKLWRSVYFVLVRTWYSVLLE
jgi:hypothetical protein